MLSFLRRTFIDSWLGMVLAILIFVAFVGWGVSDVFFGMGSSRANILAKIGQHRIEMADFETFMRVEIPAVMQRLNLTAPAQIPVNERQMMIQRILPRLIGQTEIHQAADSYGVRISDQAVRNHVFADGDFKNPHGQFDRRIFNARMQAYGIGERKWLDMVRDDLRIRAVMNPILASARMPSVIKERLFDLIAQKRVVDFAIIPFTRIGPDQPAERDIQRYYDNHPWLFRAPEYRRVRMVILSPQTVARSIHVSDKDVQTMYASRMAEYTKPELRSVQVVTLKDQARAGALAALWKSGADWKYIREHYKNDGVVELNDTQIEGIPSADLARLVFTASARKVYGPTHTAEGWVVYRVASITPPKNTSFEDVKEQLREEMTLAAAREAMPEKIQSLQDVIAGGGELDHIPADIGVAGLEGTLDSYGKTPEGEAAPFPASADLRKAMLQNIFSTAEKTAPALQRGPDDSYYAVYVERVTPSKLLPLADVRAKVIKAWQEDKARHAANERATQLYVQARDQGGVSHHVMSGVTYRHNIEVDRTQPPSDSVPAELDSAAFALRPGQSTMVESKGGFVVVTLTQIIPPDRKATQQGYKRFSDKMGEIYRRDTEMSYISLLAKKTPPQIMPGAFEHLMKAFEGN